MSTLINEKPASYIIWRSGSDYYAQNGHTNKIDFKGTLAATVINAAIAALGSGTIYFKAGTYVIAAGLDIAYNQNIHFIGEGMMSTIFDSSATPAVTKLLEVGGATDVLYGFYISDIGFKGVTGTTELLVLCNSRSSTIERCRFDQFKYGVHIDGTLGASHQNYEHCIRNCYIYGPNTTTSLAGIYMHGFDASWKCTTTTVDNNYIHDCATGVLIHYTSNSSLYGNAIEWCNIGIDIDYESNRNKFFANNIESITTMDIRIENAGANCAYNYFYACDIWGANKVDDGGFGNQFFQCAEWVTEKQGTATLLSGQNHVHVTHGLSYTPNAAEITITFIEVPTNATTYWYVGSITSSEFQLYANDPGASNLDFSWSARKCFV